MRRKLFSILVFFSLSFSQTTIAVLEFSTEGIGNVSSSALSTIVSREIMKTGEFRLIDRAAMEEILAEQGFSQTGCVSSECLVEVGQMLGVEKMVTGSLSGLGELLILDIQLINVTTGLIENNESIEHFGRIEDIVSPLRKATKSLLIGGEAANEGSFIYFQSNPPGAVIYVDGMKIGSSPITIPVEEESYNITLKAQGYADWSQLVYGKLNETVLVKAEMLELKNSSGGGDSELQTWNYLGISREDYIEFVRMGLNENEWIEKFNPIDMTINDIKIFNKYNIPKKYWADYKINRLSDIHFSVLSKSTIPKDYWIIVSKNNYNISDVEAILRRGLGEKLDECYFVISNFDTPLDKCVSVSNTITHMRYLTENGFIDGNKYNELVKEAGGFFSTMLNDNLGWSVNIDCIEFLIAKKIIKKKDHPKFVKAIAKWKNNLLKDVIWYLSTRKYESANYFTNTTIKDWTESLSVWDYYIINEMNIPPETFVKGKIAY